MLDNAGFQVVAHSPGWNAAEILVHVYMAAQKSIHFHVLTAFHVGILAVWKRAYKQMNRHNLAGFSDHVGHGFAGPVNFYFLAGLVVNVIRQTLGEHEVLISVVEFRPANRQRPFGLALGLIFIPEQAKRHTDAFQFLMYFLVIRG